MEVQFWSLGPGALRDTSAMKLNNMACSLKGPYILQDGQFISACLNGFWPQHD